MAAVVACVLVLASRSRSIALALLTKRRVMGASAHRPLVWMAKVRGATCAKIVFWAPVPMFRAVRAVPVKIWVILGSRCVGRRDVTEKTSATGVVTARTVNCWKGECVGAVEIQVKK